MNSLLRKMMRRSARGLPPRELNQAARMVRAALRAVPGLAVPDLLSPPPAARSARGGAGSRAPRTEVAPMRAGRHAGAGGIRHWKLHVPEAAEAGRGRRPLVVMLHGCQQDADDFAAGTDMNRQAGRLGWFVLYPEQAPRSNAQRCWNWFQPHDQQRGHGEPEVIAGMVREVIAHHPIDPRRVYIAGLSAGGSMAAILAREYPDLFAAAGIHSGLPAGAAHDVVSAFEAMRSGPPAPTPRRGGADSPAATKARATVAAWGADPYGAMAATGDPAHGAPVIVFHGDADRIVAPANGRRVVDASLGEHDGWRIEREAGTASLAGRAWTRHVYHDARAAQGAPSRAEHWVVHGGTHGWSGGRREGRFTDPTGPDATREMLRFFADHALPAAAAVEAADAVA